MLHAVVLLAAETLLARACWLLVPSGDSHHAAPGLCLQFAGVAVGPQQPLGTCRQAGRATVLPGHGLDLHLGALLTVTLAIALYLQCSSSPAFTGLWPKPGFGVAPISARELFPISTTYVWLQKLQNLNFFKLTQETSFNWIVSVVPAMKP